MSGGYLSCGSFIGEDKSGTAFFEMLQDIDDEISDADRDVWNLYVAHPLQELFSNQDPSDNIFVEIPSAVLNAIEPYIAKFKTNLSSRLGNPDLTNGPPEIGEFKVGEGWRLYCAWDFLRAISASQKNGKPVVLHFD